MDPGSVLLASIFAVRARRRWITLLLFGVAALVLVNLPSIVKSSQLLQSLIPFSLPERLSPLVSGIGNAIAIALILLSLIRLLMVMDSDTKFARKLAHRGDDLAAGEAFSRTGKHRLAVQHFRKARAWQDAARASLDSGDLGAASALRPIVGLQGNPLDWLSLGLTFRDRKFSETNAEATLKLWDDHVTDDGRR